MDEDSNPAIPTVPEAAVAYAQMVERTTATNAPVFTERAPIDRRPEPATLTPKVVAPPPIPSLPPQVSMVTPTVTLAAATSTEAAPKPTPPVAPVDASKASFSLLGWLKGGG